MKYKTRVKFTAANKPNAATAFQEAAAGSGYRNLAGAGYSNNDLVPYHATDIDNGGTNWEEGVGTFVSGTPNTVSRTTILESSNAGSAVDFSGGQNVIFRVAWPATTARIAHDLTDPGFTEVIADGTTTQSVTASTWTKVTNLLTVNANPYSWWDTTNKRFIPTRAGKYLLSVGAVLASLSDGAQVVVSVHKNGSPCRLISRGYSRENSGFVGSGSMVEVEANGSTDYFELYVFHTSTGSPFVRAETSNVYLTAQWIGD